MPLILQDPMENYANFVVDSPPPDIVPARHGSGFTITSTRSAIYTIPVPSRSDYLMTGCSFKLTNVALGTNQVIHHCDAIQSRLHVIVGTDGAIHIRRTAGSVILASSAAGLIANNVWYYVEFYSQCVNGGTGIGIVRVNGVEVINSSTINAGTAGPYTQIMLQTGTSSTVILDDVYLKTGVGETFLGDTTVLASWLVKTENFDSISDWTLLGTPGSASGTTGKGVQCLGATQGLTYTIPAAYESPTITMGFAWQANQNNGRNTLHLKSDAAATTHIEFRQQPTGQFSFLRAGTAVGNSATGLYTTGTWYYLEIQVVLGDSPNGSVKLRVNGVEAINVTGIDTKNGGTKTTFDAIQLTSLSSGVQYFDDLYLITGADGAFLGTQRYGTGPMDVIHEPFNALTEWTGSGTRTIVAGRTGTAVRMGGQTGAYIDLAIPARQRSDFIVFGCAVYSTSLLPAVTLVDILEGGNQRFAVRTASDGVISMSGLNPSAVGVIVTNTWQYIEGAFLLNGGNGAAWTIRVNGVVVSAAAHSGANGGASAASVATSIRFYPNSVTAGTTTFDDLYVLTGTLANFEGDQFLGLTGPPSEDAILVEAGGRRGAEAGFFRALEG